MGSVFNATTSITSRGKTVATVTFQGCVREGSLWRACMRLDVPPNLWNRAYEWVHVISGHEMHTDGSRKFIFSILLDNPVGSPSWLTRSMAYKMYKHLEQETGS